MPTTNWRTARREIMRPFGSETFATTTNITTDDKIISTELLDRFNNANYFNGWFADIEVDNDDGSSTPANGLGTTIRRAEAYAIATGELTVAGAPLTDEDEAVDVTLYRYFHPDQVKTAYNRARSLVWPHLSIHRDHRGIVTDFNSLAHPVPSTIRRIDRVYMGQGLDASHPDNLLTDGAFELWDSDLALTNWTLVGAGSTVNKETQTTGPTNHMVLSGNFSARVYVPSLTTTLRETITPDVASQMVKLSMGAYVYCLTANKVNLHLDGNDGTDRYHQGTGWEWMHYEVATDINDSSFDAGFTIWSGVTCYIDRAAVWAGAQLPPEGNFDPQQGWEWYPQTYQGTTASAGTGGQIRLASRSTSRNVLRVIGRDLLSAVSLDSDTIEIDDELVEPLYDKVRQLLCEEMAKSSPDSDWMRQAAIYEERYLQGINSDMMDTAQPHLVPSRRGSF